MATENNEAAPSILTGNEVQSILSSENNAKCKQCQECYLMLKKIMMIIMVVSGKYTWKGVKMGRRETYFTL